MIYDLLLAITSYSVEKKQRRGPMKELRKCWNNKDRSTVRLSIWPLKRIVSDFFPYFSFCVNLQ